MTQDLRFGVLTLQDIPWEDELKRWKQIDNLGFDSVWLADHFVNYMNPSAPWFESWTLLSALASHTSRIRIGTLVTSAPLRNPAVLARQAMTVDHISGGRLNLGLGAGAPGAEDPVYSMTGIADWAPPERVGRFREQVEIIDHCLSERVTNYDGKYYTHENTTIIPAPVQQPRPPITIGAMGKSMLKIAATYADTWNTIGGNFQDPPEVMMKNVKEQNEYLDKHCEKIKRDPTSLRRSLLVWGIEAESAFQSEEDFIDIIKRYRALGISEFIFYYPFFKPEQIPIFEKIAKEVIPTLRKSS